MDFLHVVLITTIISFIIYMMYKHRFTCNCGGNLEKFECSYESRDPPVYEYMTDRFEQTAQKMERQYAVFHYTCDRCDQKCNKHAFFASKLVPVGQPIPMQLCRNCHGRGKVFCDEKCGTCEGRGLIKKN